jgi:serine/threonine-protein kinase
VATQTNDVPRSAAVLAAGTRLGKYELVRLLGAGGMGAVYEAVHTQIGKRVAIKVLAPAVAARPEARARFLREAQLTSKVRHAHAVDVTDMGTEGDQTFLVMELLDGEDLATRLERDRRFAMPELVDVMLPVCSAVAAAHAAGVIHRDLKPQNIFLARSANGTLPKVLDFGISKAQDTATVDALTGSGAVIGTPYYLAPEQVIDSRSASPASDQYAIGVVLYECVTGVRPFQAESLYGVFHAIVAGTPARPRERLPDIDAQFEAVVMRAMHGSADGRFPSVIELGRALWPFASERGRMLWREAFGASQPRALARPPSSSKETAVDDAVRTPRWPGRDAAAAIVPAPATRTPAPASMPPGIFTSQATTAPRRRASFGVGVAVAMLALGGGALWFATSRLRNGETARPPAVEPARPISTPAPPAPAAAHPPAPPPEVVSPPAPVPVAAPPAPSPATAESVRAHAHKRPGPRRKDTAAPAAPADVQRAGPNHAPLVE